MADHDGMAVDSVEASARSSREASADPCGPRRDSLQDADPSLTRKRQRLDSDARPVSRSMSADRAPSSHRDESPSTVSNPLPHTPPSLPQRSPITPERPAPSSSHKRTSSKVTINVRTPQAVSSKASSAMAPNEQGSASPDPGANNAYTMFNNPSATDDVAAKVDTNNPSLLSPSSSPVGSPKIEIAEVEDMDQEYPASTWTPMVSLVTSRQGALLENFPFYSDGSDPKAIVLHVNNLLEKGSDTNGLIIGELTRWFAMCVKTAEHKSFDWYEVYSEHQLFWDEVPNLIEGLLRRRLPFEGDFMKSSPAAGDQSEIHLLEDLFVAFSRLCRQLILVDINTLQHSRHSKEEPDLISLRYQLILSWTLLGAGSDDVCLWQVLQKLYNADVDPLVASIASHLSQTPSNGLEHLTIFAQLVVERIPLCHKLASKAWYSIWIAQRLVDVSIDKFATGTVDDQGESAIWHQIPRDARHLCEVVYWQLHQIVEKQASLPRDLLKESCHHLSNLLHAVAQASRQIAQELYEVKEGSRAGLSDDDLPQLVNRAWKLSLLKKCMVAGRMEVRAQGLEYMSEELLDAWTKYGSTDITHPVMVFLANFILKHSLVEYLVGVDSHLQLMDRGTNIIGFLVVTHKYTSHETDTIWHAVTTSQNPRAVAAILSMLKGIFTLSKYSSLVYLCQKLNEVPLQCFDGAMMAYAAALLGNTREKFRQVQQRAKLDIHPYDLCIRLIREATSSDIPSAHGASEVCQFALKQLSELMALGPELSERKRIYQECVRDIGQKNSHAVGSIYVINSLLGQHRSPADMAVDLSVLANELDLTRLLIEELACTLDSDATNNSRQTAVKPRLDLLALLIIYESPSITAHLADQLWDSLFGKDPLGLQERDAGWNMLCGVMNRIRSRNGFITRCIDVYLPALQPEHFTPAVLGFSQQAIQYEHRLDPPRPACEHEIVIIAGTEQVWRIVLGAPDHAIATQAIQFLVDLYLTAPVIEKAPPSAVEATHLAIVDRCVAQLTSAASKLRSYNDGTMSGEDEPMVLVASEDEIRAEEQSFSRSLLLLREILHRLRNDPHHSPRPRTVTVMPETPVSDQVMNGELVQIRYQMSAGNSEAPIKIMDVGDQETCDELRESFARATGFPTFKLYCAGFLLDLHENASRSIRHLNFGPNPFIIVNQIHEKADEHDDTSLGGLTSVEVELLKHFDELYDLLGMDERLAGEIWEFLNAFAPQGKVRKNVTSESNADVFPPGQPFKIMYSAKTLRICLDERLQKGITDETFITHSVRAIIAALTSESLLEGVASPQLKIKVLNVLVDCLLRFLKEPVMDETSASYFTDESNLVTCLVAILKATRSPQTWSSSEGALLATGSFSAILEASLHSVGFWTTFTSRPDAADTIQHLLLDDMRVFLRERTGEIIASFCKILPTPSKVTATEFSSYFWRVLSSILPYTTEKQATSAQFFDASLAVFRSIGECARDTLDLDTYIRDWGNLLVNHKHEEVVGKDTVDNIIYGLTRLLYWSVQLAKSFKQPIDTGSLAEKVFTRYLFPPLSQLSGDEPIAERVPVLHSQTRHELNQLVLLLAQDDERYRKILGLVSDLVSERRYTLLADLNEADGSPAASYNFGWQSQRSKWIRAPSGYVGLQNLSNTCYLNSLFTQLFMNVGFRGFMLEANVADAEGSQRLLSETQKLFAYMQNSWAVSVEPKDLASSIRTYDDDNIDVTIQMDVDEFYNLLFDRWEGQILSDEAKKMFRSFYGGQLVQQVKSKECSHISEREEPFSAIQCDIKGKATLQDSLKAYVEGDIMEGDNKYSCTTCNRHVDAVKRTCLKEIPNNLIFHLKRFDFDLRQMQRSKINDHFSFPEILDLKPYTMHHLSDPDSSAGEDPFELVGVLVHSGTAESGHYYSFIRERPITSLSQTPGWVQFNDADVTSWDPSNIAAQCFGGQETWPQSRDDPPLVLPKAYSAYMLFYERSSSLKAEQQAQESFAAGSPKKLPISLELSKHIACDNELFIRKYCLYDPYHPLFVKSLLDSLRHVSKGICSEDHELEKTAINLTLQHVDSVIARTKDIPDFDGMMHSLFRVIGSCAQCCKIALDWVIGNVEAMRNLLLRCPVPKVRQEFSRMIVTALRYLRDKDAALYGIEITSEDPTDWTESYGAFQEMLSRLITFWDILDSHMRSWDDYFGLVVQIVLMGEPEIIAILHEGFLLKGLEMVIAEFHPELKASYERMIRLLSKGRKASYNKLIEMIYLLLGRLDITYYQTVLDEQSRTTSANLDSYPLTRAEESCLNLHIRHDKNMVFISKMLDLNHNPVAARGIIAQMVRADGDYGWLSNIHKTLAGGITIDPASLAGPYLQAAISFCENAPSTMEVKELIARTAREVDTIGSHGGREHLMFFATLASLKNDRWPNAIHFFHMRVLECMAYWAPVLLVYWDPGVREDTETLLHKIAFDHGAPADTGYERVDGVIDRSARELGNACLAKIQDKWVSAKCHMDVILADPIMRVLQSCRPYFDDAGEYEFRHKIELAASQLRNLIVEEVDEAASDEWDNDSNMASDSSDIDPTTIPVEPASP